MHGGMESLLRVDWLAFVGRSFLVFLAWLGQLAGLMGELLIGLKSCRWRLKLVAQQIVAIGYGSQLVVVVTGAFTGAVFAFQSFAKFKEFGIESTVGAIVSVALCRELGPVLAALMVTGRAGSAITAEIGIMRITEQIDALETMALDPFKYLVTPKFIAAMISLPLLCAIFDVIGIYGGWLVGVKLLGVNPGAYFYEMEKAVVWRDVYSGFVKSFSFGIIIAWIGCYKGYYAGHGAEGVSKATTESVVLTSVIILVWDYFLTSVLL